VSGRPTLTQALWRDHALSRNVLLFVALAGTIGAIVAGLDHPRAWWLLALFVPLLLITVIDLAQTHHSLRRNYPGSARLRWFFEWLRPFLRSYIVESDLDGRPFSHDERALVYARAKGDVSTHPFGTELDVYSEEYEWLAHSMAPTRDAERYTRVTVGTDQCSKPYQAARLNISAMSFGALSANAIEALNLGAKIGGFYHDTGEGGLSPYHLKHGGDVVWEIGSGYFGCRDAKGHFHPEHFRERAGHDAVVMTEIKLSQGAKPGHGGLLPGAKVTAEIAKIRDVPEVRIVFRRPITRPFRPREACWNLPLGCGNCPAANRSASSFASAIRTNCSRSSRLWSRRRYCSISSSSTEPKGAPALPRPNCPTAWACPCARG